MKTTLSILIAVIATCLPLHAAPDRVMTVKASVDGMVCAFCAQGLLAHFRNHAAVSDIHVDLTRKLVILEERKGAAISDKEIRDAVKRAGFDASGEIKRVTTPFQEVKKAK
jgi:mercuric ion binding protein